MKTLGLMFTMISCVVCSPLFGAGSLGCPEPPVLFVDVWGEKFELELGDFKGEREAYGCTDFKLDEVSATFFLRHSRLANSITFEKSYPYYPCWVEGTLKRPGGDLEWWIAPGGKGAVSGGGLKEVFLVCDDCEEQFPYGGNMFCD